MKIEGNAPKLLTVLASEVQNGTDNIGEAKGFGDMLKEAVNSVNQRLVNAEELSTQLALGKPVDIAQVMTAMSKADISFRLLLQVRNKALSAYEEIMRMQF